MSENNTAPIEPEDVRIVTRDGHPAVELPTGQVLELRTHMKVEDRLERPLRGRTMDMNIDVDADEGAWWTLWPDDDEEPAAVEELVIEPYLRDGDCDE